MSKANILLDEKQIRAFRLADNKVAEKSEWDFELLDFEIEELSDDFDFEALGFEFDDHDDVFQEHQKNKEDTQMSKANILNLEIAQFPGVGKYDIPEIQPVTNLPEITEWIGFNYVLSDKSSYEEKAHKGVHFFVDDYQFERIWNNPDMYMEKLLPYGAVCSPDFSPYGDMPLATQIFNHYRKHWVAAYMQSFGITVIPTIRKSTDPRSDEWYLEGEPHGGIVIISSMWSTKSDVKDLFVRSYQEMIDRLHPSKVLIYGKKVDGLAGNVEYVKSFLEGRYR